MEIGEPADRKGLNRTPGMNMQTVTMYTTAVCPYCTRAKQLLHARGVQAIDEIRVDSDNAARVTMMERTGRRTVPQIFIGQTHVGGCDELVALDAKGELRPLLEAT
jgi:glutaredoxin 3